MLFFFKIIFLFLNTHLVSSSVDCVWNSEFVSKQLQLTALSPNLDRLTCAVMGNEDFNNTRFQTCIKAALKKVGEFQQLTDLTEEERLQMAQDANACRPYLEDCELTDKIHLCFMALYLDLDLKSPVGENQKENSQLNILETVGHR